MDHLPYPHLGVPPIVVPYLPGFEYDGEDFATFPDRVGFWKDGNWDLNRPYRQLAALAQAWLFFGLIDVFTTERMNKEVLIRRSDSNRVDEGVIDTTALGGIVEEGVKRKKMLLSSPEVFDGVRAQLMEAARASSTLDRIQSDDSPSSAVFLSIKILIIYLSEIFEAAFWSHVGPEIPSKLLKDSFRYGILERRGSDGGLPAPARLLMDRMRQSGWCIHQIMEIFRDHNYCTVYYYSSIARAESWDHISHEACTEAQCVAYNIKDDSEYKIRHIEECSGCDLIGPSENEVADIVRDGNIPLVELEPVSLDNQTKLTVRSATPHSRYTAISHVWIDGHGNPTANALPRCQLRRLAARLSAISEAQQSWMDRLWNRLRYPSPKSHLMWMDTLCIPPRQDLDEQKLLRKKAIHRMVLIYVGAAQVLVLDAELDKITHGCSPRELTDALISCARWNSRCWTLEEGALSRKCLFHFKDAAKEVKLPKESTSRTILTALMSPWSAVKAWWCVWADLSSRQRSIPVWPPRKISPAFAHDYLRRELANAARRSAQMDARHWRHAAGRVKPGLKRQVDKFVRTWNDLGRRSTTRPEDVHPILANLTDFSAAQIMELETPELRTKMIAHCIGFVPLDLLWTPCTRPLANQNSVDRWVPSIPGPEPLVEHVKLLSAAEGLLLYPESWCDPPETFWIPQGMVAPRFCFHWLHNNERELWYVVECIMTEDDALPRSASEPACLILSPNAANGKITAASQVLRGARLLVTQGSSETSESLYLRYDCPLICTIQTTRPEVDQISDTPIMTVDKVSGSRMHIIESEFNPKDREQLNMRSRDFYYGTGMEYIQGITIVTIIMILTAALGISVGSAYPTHLSQLFGVILPVDGILGLASVNVALRWRRARAYNAWKATFEEDWRPRGSACSQIAKAVRLPRKRGKSSQEEELVNV